jgi:hypothetical protein
MFEEKHLIAPENMGLWAVVAFILALLALIVSLVNLYRTSEMMAITQAEILMLNSKVQAGPNPLLAPDAATQEEK